MTPVTQLVECLLLHARAATDGRGFKSRPAREQKTTGPDGKPSGLDQLGPRSVDMGMTRLRRVATEQCSLPGCYLSMALQTNSGSLSADFNAQEDVTTELANEAIDRMTATDEAAAQVDHSDYDPVEAVLADTESGGVALG